MLCIPLLFIMELICFDLDNTLINSDRAHYRAYNKALRQLGYKKFSYNEMVKHFGAPKIEMAKLLTSTNKKEVILKITELHAKFLLQEAIQDARKIKGAIPTIKKLRKDYKIGLLSNNRHSSIMHLLKCTHINKNLFDVIVGNDDVKHAKPYPDEILKAEKLLHLKASYMVGDSKYDIIAGKKAKVRTIAVLTGHYSRLELRRYKPDHIINSVSDIPGILYRKPYKSFANKLKLWKSKRKRAAYTQKKAGKS